MRRYGFLLLLVLLLSRQGMSAQDTEYTCDEGESYIVDAVQEAYVAEDYQRAWDLANQASIMCIDELSLLRRVAIMRRNAQRQIASEALQPGKVDLGNYSLYLVCMGEGSPTVIFESEFYQGFTEWADIQAPISTLTRTCTYSRLGRILSDPIPDRMIQTTQDQVDDLVALLDTAEEDGPFIFVGNLIAAFNILLMADQYPERVAGIVLLDGRHPDHSARELEANPDAAQVDLTGMQFDLPTSEAQASGITDLGDRPLYVLSSDRGTAGDPLSLELQELFATYSTDSVHTIAERSDYHSPDQRPDLVIKAILWVLEELERDA